MWETTRRNRGTSVKAILHSGYVFLAHWGCCQHPCDLVLLPPAWEDIRDHHDSAAGTDSSGHPRGWLCHRKGRVPSARAMHGGGTLHGPALSWCSFIFSSRADGGCRGEEKGSIVSDRSLKPSANVDKWNN